MSDLIKVELNANQEPIVNSRELYNALEVKTAYKDWFPRMCEYGFKDGQDYTEILEEVDAQKRARTYEQTNHVLKLDMAKEIAMLQRTEKGKEVRQYFIQIEKDFNSPEKIMARALSIANIQLKTLQIENNQSKQLIAEQKPKVLFADSVTASHTSILIGELAKIIKQNGHDIGQNRLFDWLRDNSYLISRKGTDYNMPTQKSMELGLFEIKETTITHADGHISISKTAKVTGKGQVYFVNKFVGETKELEPIKNF